MTKDRERRPKPEELSLFQAAMRAAKPLPGRRAPKPAPLRPPAPAPVAAPQPLSRAALGAEKMGTLLGKTRALPKASPVPVVAGAARAVAPLAPKLQRALARGAVPLEARLDLHGFTQERARDTIERFLAHARARGYRHVLVVTGKGAAGPNTNAPFTDEAPRGILRAMLPRWLALPPLCDWVIGVSPAGPRHGGAGALYIHLRKARAR